MACEDDDVVSESASSSENPTPSSEVIIDAESHEAPSSESNASVEDSQSTSDVESGEDEMSEDESNDGHCKIPKRRKCLKRKKEKAKKVVDSCQKLSHRHKAAQCDSSQHFDASSSGDSSEKQISEPSVSNNEEREIEESEESSHAADASDSSNTNTTPQSRPPSAQDWSLSEDEQLRGMKEDEREITWKDIGAALGRRPSDAKARWKYLKTQPRLFSSEEARRSNDNGDSDAIAKQRKQRGHRKTPIETKQDGPTSMARGHRGKPRNDKVAAENKAARSKASTTAKSTNFQSGDEPSSEAGSDGEAANSDSNSSTYVGNARYDSLEQEHRHQRRYLHRHIYARLYPPTISPQADDFLSPDDCAILATMHSRHELSRWLEMQANFYNVTGRMLPLSVIRQRCERAGAAQSAEPALAEATLSAEARDQVERWVTQILEERGDSRT
jgi:hypothetical protein